MPFVCILYKILHKQADLSVYFAYEKKICAVNHAACFAFVPILSLLLQQKPQENPSGNVSRETTDYYAGESENFAVTVERVGESASSLRTALSPT